MSFPLLTQSLGDHLQLLGEGEPGSKFLQLANDGDEQALRILRRIRNRQVSETLLRELDKSLQRTELKGVVHRKPGSLELGFELLSLTSHGEDDVDDYTALLAMLFIANGGPERLRRCQLNHPNKRCRNYFLGTQRAKWCSNTCGTYHRIMEKRDRDREQIK